MLSSILVPLDGTAESSAALPLARSVARETGASITLLRVVQPTDLTSDREAFTEATATLQRIADEMAGADLHVESVVHVGADIADEILQQSRAQGADLIIMRTHGRVGLGRAVLGSVTQRVLAESSVPVMLLRPGGRRIDHIRKLLVPIDGSPGGAVALGTAVGIAQRTGASMKLLEVAVPIPTFVYAGDAYGGMGYYDPAWDEETLASARVYVDGIVKRLGAAGLVVDGEVRQERDVADTIVATAEQAMADLIVMSTQALTGPARALLGSVADAIVRSAHCPVLLVHRAEAAEAPGVQVELEPASEASAPASV
jgi:nucleotide-binding universal stress UspA family protein